VTQVEISDISGEITFYTSVEISRLGTEKNPTVFSIEFLVITRVSCN
jgi:hypothetical protein